MRVIELPAAGAPLRETQRPLLERGRGVVCVQVRACGVAGSGHFRQKGGHIPHDILDAIDLHSRGGISVEHIVERVRPLAEADAAPHDLTIRAFRSVLTPSVA